MAVQSVPFFVALVFFSSAHPNVQICDAVFSLPCELVSHRMSPLGDAVPSTHASSSSRWMHMKCIMDAFYHLFQKFDVSFLDRSTFPSIILVVLLLPGRYSGRTVVTLCSLSDDALMAITGVMG